MQKSRYTKGYTPRRQYNRKPTKQKYASSKEILKEDDKCLARRIIRDSLGLVYRGYDNFADAYDHVTKYQVKHGRTLTGAVLGTVLLISLERLIKKG